MANPALSTAAATRGLKRVCASCGIRFYDLNKRPIACPNCGTEFSGEIKLKGRRSRVVTESQVAEKNARLPQSGEEVEDDQDVVIEAESDTVSLDDVEVMEKEDADEEDIDLEGGDLEGLEDMDDVDDLDEDDVDEDLGVEDEKA